MAHENPEQARWFAEKVEPHTAHLRAWLKARFSSLNDVDDVVQEALVKLLRAHESGPIACPKAFLFVCAKNLALNHLRHQRYERPDALAEMEPPDVHNDVTDIPESVSRDEEIQILMKAIQSLPDRCRQIVTLRKIYGLSQREVAIRLGISEHTVEAQGGIGLHKCGEYFRRNGYRSLRRK